MALQSFTVPVTIEVTFQCEFRLEGGVWSGKVEGLPVSESTDGFLPLKAKIQAALESFIYKQTQ